MDITTAHFMLVLQDLVIIRHTVPTNTSHLLKLVGLCSKDINRDSKSRSRVSGRDEVGEGILAKDKLGTLIVGTVTNYGPHPWARAGW